MLLQERSHDGDLPDVADVGDWLEKESPLTIAVLAPVEVIRNFDSVQLS